MPLPKSYNITYHESGNTASTCNAKKKSFNDIVKTALFCALCFSVLLLTGNNSFPSPARGSVVDEVVRTMINGDSLDRLKKHFVDDELELSWDRQHITELQDNMQLMKNSYGKLRSQFQEQEDNLRKKSESLRETIASTSNLHSSVRQLDQDMFLQLARQADRVHVDLDHERAENAELKKLLAETINEMKKQNIPIPQAALRGSPLKAK